MQSNRRNYYRILQVQPEAPIQVIKASWRALMCSAKMHPDLGGDHAAAALINEAFEVLSDPAKKRDYDARLALQHARPGTDGAVTGHATATPSAQSPACALCRLPHSGPIQEGSRCARCAAPLVPAARPGEAKREPLGRRTGARWPRHEAAEIRVGWPTQRVDARLLDMSLGGLSFNTAKPVKVGEFVRVTTRHFDSVVAVVASRPSASGWRSRARFITLIRITRTGAFLSQSV